MPLYRWKGMDASGNTCKGSMDAVSVNQLEQHLLAKNIALLKHTQPWALHAYVTTLPTRQISNEHVFAFFEQMATLLDSGIELLPALEVTARLTRFSPMQTVIQSIIEHIKQGQDLQVLLAQYPAIFSKTTQKLIGAGEKTGKLGFVLASLKDLLRIRITMYQQLRKAAMLPLITLVIALGLISCIFVFILPHFEVLYQSLGCPLPQATQIALQISRWLHSWVGIATTLSLLALAPITVKYTCATRGTKRAIDRLSIHLPLVGQLIIYKELIIFSSVIEIFLRSGLPLAQALSHAIAATSNTTFKENLQQAMSQLQQGQSLSSALQAYPSAFIDEQYIALIHIGEQSGTLDSVMHKASTLYQHKLTTALHTVTTLATPMLTVFIGLIIGGLMVTIYLPIFKMGTLFNH